MTAKEEFLNACERHGFSVLDFVWRGYVEVYDNRLGYKRTIRTCEIPENEVDDFVMSWILEGVWSS
jgi:hypothetical protein